MRTLIALLLLSCTLQAQEKEQALPTLAYVYQTPCPPCRLAKEVLERLKKDNTLKGFKLIELELQTNKEYLADLKVTRTPSFFLLDKKGKLLGILNDNRELSLRDFLKKHKPSTSFTIVTSP
jgi:thiol-disulfide isomerase/thioredoxin